MVLEEKNHKAQELKSSSLTHSILVWALRRLRRQEGSPFSPVCIVTRGAVSSESPLPSNSLTIVLLHVSLGRPRFILPCGVLCRALLVTESAGMRQTCPSHLQRRPYIIFSTVAIPVLRQSSSFDIVFGQKIFKIRRRRLFRNTSNFCVMALVVFQYYVP